MVLLHPGEPAPATRERDEAGPSTFPVATAWSPSQCALAKGTKRWQPRDSLQWNAWLLPHENPTLNTTGGTSPEASTPLPGDLQAQAGNHPAVRLRLHRRRGRPRCPATARFLGYNQLPSSRDRHIGRQCMGTRNRSSQPQSEKKLQAIGYILIFTISACLREVC